MFGLRIAFALLFVFILVFASFSSAQLLGLGLECASRIAKKSVDIRVSIAEASTSKFNNIAEGASIDITNTLVFTVDKVNASVSCDESCGSIVSNKEASFSVRDKNGTPESFESRREGDFVIVGSATLWIDGITAAGECAIKCKDESLSGECSKTKPLFCSNGVLVNKSSVCGCPAGLGMTGEECAPFLCEDGTRYGTCSLKKPLYCDEGKTINKSSVCGCPLGQNVSGESCAFPKCDDGTSYSACSESKPSYCEGGVLVNKSSVCGCPSGLTPFRNACRKPVCADGTVFGECSFNRPFFCTQQGVLAKKASLCGCPRDYAVSEDECVLKKCFDGTPYNECSASKPNFCFNGTFIEDPVSCGCPENYAIGAVGCVPLVGVEEAEKNKAMSLIEATLKYLAVGLTILAVFYVIYHKFMGKRRSMEEKEKWISGEYESEGESGGIEEIGELPKKKK